MKRIQHLSPANNLQSAIQKGLESGIEKNFDPEKHLLQLKRKLKK